MKKLVGFAMVALLVLAAAPMASAGTIGFDFSNNAGGGLRFSGPGNLSFFGTFSITGQSGSWPNGTALTGLQGSVSGSYAIGAITTVGPTQSASLTGSGVFTIVTGSGNFTANVTWIDIETVGASGSATGSLNTQGAVNLSNLQYTGTNADLIALVSALGPTATVTFQSVTGKTLTQLKAGADLLVPFRASLTAETQAVPEPSTLLLLGSGLLGVAAWRFRK